MTLTLKDDVASCDAACRAYDAEHGTRLAELGNVALARIMKQQLHRRALSSGDIRDLDHEELVYFMEYLVLEERGGFRKCVDAGLPECTSEATILRHRSQFSSHIVEICVERLRKYGLDQLIPPVDVGRQPRPQPPTCSLTKLFANFIRIPLRNSQWSWGVYDDESCRVILRVWEDEISHDDIGAIVVILDDNRTYTSNGYVERKHHIAKLRSGATGFGIVCEPKVNPSGGRNIKRFYEDQAARFGEVFEKEGRTYARIVDWVPLYVLFKTESWQQSISEDLFEVEQDPSLSETTREQLTLARLGQGRFRSDVLALWGNRCAVSGVELPEVIRASHIKPWRHSDNTERLDAHNGIPLIATLDALFDRLLISFDNSGRLMISSLVSSFEREQLGLGRFQEVRKPFVNELLPYLQWHQGAFAERTKGLERTQPNKQ